MKKILRLNSKKYNEIMKLDGTIKQYAAQIRNISNNINIPLRFIFKIGDDILYNKMIHPDKTR